MRKLNFIAVFAATILLAASCNKSKVEIQSGELQLLYNSKMETKIVAANTATHALTNNYSSSEYIVTKQFTANNFGLTKSETENFISETGNGKKFLLEGNYTENGYSINKLLEVTVFDSFPGMAVTKVRYINTGAKNFDVLKWVNNQYKINATSSEPAFWSFQGSSSGARADWILPVDSAFSQQNFMGLNNTDYGGGIPVINIWRPDIGIAVGHLELSPKLVSLPVEKNQYENAASIAVESAFNEPKTLRPNDTLYTLTTFVYLHNGDCYNALAAYSKIMQARGITFAPEEPEAFEAVWCAWGYERKFTLAEVEGTLPKVKELGIKWVDIDDGFQAAEGDWAVPQGRFPNGNNDMRRLVDKIHALGMKAKIWWAPLAADPCSELFRKNPDMIVHTPDGAPQYITWWDSYYLAPEYSKTIEHTKSVLNLFLKEWDFDGLKMDGQHLNCVSPNHNHTHNLQCPTQSFEQLPEFFKMVFNEAQALKPNAVIQNCPCGCVMSFFNLPYMNQAVASDPTSSWQIRLKNKVYKALRPGLAYYGDHIEMTEGGNDFATQIGIGAVLGTKFTWPKDNPYATQGTFVLTPEKEKVWKKWIQLYNNKMLSKGEYLGSLYDIGFHKPETHVIKKMDTLYYAFYAKEWSGTIELKGLTDGKYNIRDYVNDINIGSIDAAKPEMHFSFKKNLLIEVSRAE